MAESELIDIQHQTLQDEQQQQQKQDKVNGVGKCSMPSQTVRVLGEEVEDKKEAENIDRFITDKERDIADVKITKDVIESVFLVSKSNHDKHTENDPGEPPECSSNGTTTPSIVSTNSSPTSDLSENKSVCSDKAEVSSDNSSTKELKTTNQQQRLKYSRDQLLRLMDVPASRLWPEYFDMAFKKSQGKFDLERWMKAKQDVQRSNGSSLAAITPSVLLAGSGMFPECPRDIDLKKSRDPRERIKEDQDGIILSPQRRSFGTGCHVSQQSTIGMSSSGTDSVLDRTRESHREIATRRIGSGRILRREEPDFVCGERRRDRDERDLEPPRRDHGKDWRSKTDGRFDRDRPEDRNSSSAKFLQQFNSRQESGKHDAGHINLSRKLDPSSSFRLSGHMDKRRRFFEEEEKRVDRRDLRDRRYNDHRRSSMPKEVEEETPEWFTRGPSSQNEYIELVGFDESPDEKRVSGSNEAVAQEGSGASHLMQFFKNSATPVKEVEHFTNSASPDHDKFTKAGGSGRNSASHTPVVMEETTKAGPLPVEDLPSKVPKNPIVVEPHSSNEQDAMQFNVEDYLGSILNFGPEEMVVQGGSRASRLKPFFKNRDSPVKEVEHPLNSASFSNQKDKFSMLGFSECAVRMSPPANHIESPHFFTPISPAGKTGGDALVEMLHQATGTKVIEHHQMPGSGRLPPPSVKELLMGGKGQSLEEIEASLRKEQQPPLQQGSTLMMGPNSYGPSNMMKQQLQQPPPTLAPIQAPCRKQQGIMTQHNLFSDFLLKDSSNNHNVISNKPAMPTNAPTESELIARLIKSGVNPPGNIGMGSIPSINGPPPPSSQSLGGLGARHQHQAPIGALSMPKQLSPHAPHTSTLPQQSPSRTHLMPPHQSQAQLPSNSSNSEIFVKLLQNNQHKLLHPGYQPQSQQQQQTLQHDPIKQLIGGMNNLGLNSLHPNQDHLREAILRPDIQSLLQRVVNGQVNEAQLMAQLNSGTMTHSQREAIATVLKLIAFPNPTPTPLMPHRPNLAPSPTPQSMLTGGLPLGTNTSLSPRVASPNPDAGNVLTPHMLQQARVSPLIFGGNSVPRRTPSYQELVVRAQRILQGALLKQELEKAKEKHRRKDAERTHSPNPAASCLQNGPASHSASMNRPNQDGSPSKGPKCQSPLAFTPTSVMRKMTAEKERLDKDKQTDGFYSFSIGENDKTREHISRMVTNHSQNPAIHHPGMNLKVDKRIRKAPSPLPTGNSMLGPRAQMVMSGAPTNPLLNISPPPPSHGMGPQRHMTLQAGRSTQAPNVDSIRVAMQQAQAHQQLLVPTIGASGLGQQHPYMHPRLAPNPQNNTMQHLVIGNNNNYKSGDNTLQVPYGGVSAASPNNSPVNLMNLFGRDLMAKVHAGAMPELPGGKALSLEEVERIQQTQTVPN